MSEVLHRLRDVFLASPAAQPVPTVVVAAAERALPAAVGVLCAPGDSAAACAVGLVLAARRGAACAVVCRWTGADEPSTADRLALPGAARLARRLRGRELAATASGRLVLVELPPGAQDARAVAGRVAGSVDGAPLILAVAGPRPAAFADLLAAQDRLLVVPPPGAADGLADLAVVDAARAGRAAGVLGLSWGAGARALALRGLAVPRSVRAATAAALEGRDA